MVDKTFVIILISMLPINYQLEVSTLHVKCVTEAELTPF